MRHEAAFRFSADYAGAVYHSVAPEQGDYGSRSVGNLRLEDDATLALNISAADVSALRAALNSWLRLINVAKEMQEIVIDE